MSSRAARRAVIGGEGERYHRVRLWLQTRYYTDDMRKALYTPYSGYHNWVLAGYEFFDVMPFTHDFTNVRIDLNKPRGEDT